MAVDDAGSGTVGLDEPSTSCADSVPPRHGDEVDTVGLDEQSSSCADSVPPRHGDEVGTVKPSLTSNTDLLHTPTSDVTGDYVSCEIPEAWIQQLVDVSTMLSRFITLEYFSDGAALTKALSFG